jgi:hypothetical protein
MTVTGGHRFMQTPLAAVVLVALTASAHAGPAARAYSQAMAGGARQMAAKDFRAAATSFQTALDARPDDPRALAELSWASFLSSDFAAAAQAARRATYYTRDPQLQAMAYYNLGRASEALGATVDAEVAYAASLDLRNNPEVRTRLKHLAPALLLPHRLAGPFARPEDSCKSPCEVDHDVSPRWSGAAGLASPFRDAVKIDVDDPGNYPLVSIGVELTDGWYVLPAIGLAARGHGGQHSAALRMVGHRLVVDWNEEVGRFGHNDTSAIFVCGLAGKQPSCVGPLVFRQADEVDRCGKDPDCTIRNVYSVRFRCRVDLRGDVVELTRDLGEIEMTEGIDTALPRPDICDALPIAGKHTLTF